MAEKLYALSEAQARELRNLIAWKKNLRVMGARLFRNGDTTCTIDVGVVEQKRTAQGKLQMVLFKITGNAAGGGKYTGKTVDPSGVTSDVSGSGNLAESDLGTVAGSNDVLALNFDEVGQSTHILSTSYLPLVFVGYLIKTNSDGTKVVGFHGEPFENCG